MDILEKSINYLKSLSAETISNAKSGHTGSSIGASSIIFSLFLDHLNFNPKDTRFLNRDRFVLSSGHMSALLYSTLHLFGFDISIDDLKNFRKYNSKTPGHPEYNLDCGIENTSGPLGQGVAHAVGLAIAESYLQEKFNTKEHQIISNKTYCLCGDGCLMEGVAVEACSLAGTLNLKNLVLLYDDNATTIEGNKNIANKENTVLKFQSMGWNVLLVKNGNNPKECSKAIKLSQKSNRPTIIIFKTKIGIGTKKEGLCASHGMPLSCDDLKEFKNSLSITESFFVPEDVKSFCNKTILKNQEKYNTWLKVVADYKNNYPEKFKELQKFLKTPKINFEKILNNLKKQPTMAGRDLCHVALNLLSQQLDNFIGGTADLAPSTKAFIENANYFSDENRLGKNIHYGIREHAMGAIANGISLYSNLYTFDSTFLTFSNYMLPPLRLRAMMNLPVLSIFTHDAINIGEDGPTHQPIEQLSQLRQIVGLNVFRPATSAEIVFAMKFFVEEKLPTALIISKSKLPDFENSTLENASRGGYVIFETKKKPEIEIIATGSEVQLAISLANELETIGARVISMPCEKLFENQDKTYKNKVLLKNPKLKVVIEASNDNVWFKYINNDDLLINIENYQTSANGKEVYEKSGFEKELILKKILKKIK